MSQDKYNSIFAERLRSLIASHKTTITALSKSLGISRQAVSQYADGTGQPNVEKLRKIANFFHVSADYLIGLSDIPTQNVSLIEELTDINDVTGLSMMAILELQINKDIEDNEIADFVSYLITNEKLSQLIQAIKQKNSDCDTSCDYIIIDGFDYAVNMPDMLKMVIANLFFEVIEGYTAKPGEIMGECQEGGSNG